MVNPEKRFFYILGFPRSRSTWFSQFLSTNVSRCYHEILSSNDLKAFENYMLHYDAQYVGSADTNPISFSKTAKAVGNMVLIYRDPKQALAAIRNAFNRHMAFTADEWEKYTENMIDMYDVCLGWYRDNEPNLLYVNFEEMEDDQTLMRIFKHCIPAYDPDWSYIESMQGLKITVKSRNGLRNGIDTSIKNIESEIGPFKASHVKDYDHDKFKELFYKGMFLDRYEKPDEPSKLISISGPGLMGARDN